MNRLILALLLLTSSSFASVQGGSTSVTSSVLPTGASTSANQSTEITKLTSIDGKIPASPSQEHTTAASPNACRISDGAAFVSVATAANQSTANASLSSIDGKLPSLMSAAPGSDTGQASVPVRVISSLAAGGSGSNGAASATGSPVPAQASYTGYNSGGSLVGVSTANPLPVSQQGSVAVTGTFWQATQPVSGTVGVSNAFALDATLTGGTAQSIVRSATKGTSTGAGVTSTATDANHQALDVNVNNSVPVTGTFWQATQPVSGTLTCNAGTGTLAVSDTATGATAATAPTRAILAGGVFNTTPATITTGQMGQLQLDSTQNLLTKINTALPAGTNVIGHVIADTGSTTAVTALPALPTGANTIGNVGLVAGAAKVGQVAIDQTTPGTTNLVSIGTNGTVGITNAAAVAKGTQGANAVPTQALLDSGRSARTISLDGFAVAATTETLNTMSYSSDNGTATTGTSYTVTAGKRLRIQQITASIHTIAGNTTAATCIVRIRANNAGAAIVTSPIQYVMALPGTAAANSSAGPIATQFPDGWEFVAAAGIGVTTTCPGFVATTAAPKVNISITGFEY